MVDLAILLDGSSSLDGTSFKTVLQFIESLVKSFTIESSKGRVGLIEYSDNAKVVFGFDRHLDDNSVAKAISKLQVLGGGTQTGKSYQCLNIKYSTLVRRGSSQTDQKQLNLLHTSDVSTTAIAITSARTFTLEHKRRKQGVSYLALTIALTFCRFILEDFWHKRNRMSKTRAKFSFF